MVERKYSKIKLAIGVISGIALYAGWRLAPGVRIGMPGDYQTAASMFWDHLDLNIFYWFNGTLMQPGTWRDVLAVANNRAFDLVSAFLMILIYSFYIFSGTKEEMRKRIALGVFLSIYMIASTQLMSNAIFRFNRTSPTRTGQVSPSIRISKLYSWKLKDASKNSFPGDHATVLMIIGGFICFHGRKKRYIIPAVITAIIFSMPRMFSGAHWFSDVVVGGGSTALIFLSIAFYTPFTDKCVAKLQPHVNRVCDFLAKFIPVLSA
ncbi:MAG: phosphatase PAP2 family protein [bacterium]|nr:phosphatase PAP2 family protein [bacterium]